MKASFVLRSFEEQTAKYLPFVFELLPLRCLCLAYLEQFRRTEEENEREAGELQLLVRSQSDTSVTS